MRKYERIRPGVRRQNRQERWYTVIGRTGERAYATGKPVYEIRFDSGYVTTATSQDMHRGKIQDKGAPTVCGVGVVGWEIENPGQHPLYSIWHGMIVRCYTHHERYRCWFGVTVCDRWHRFPEFAADAPNLPGYDLNRIRNRELVLDKDKLGALCGKPVYGPETCSWLDYNESAAFRRYRPKEAVPTCPYRGVHWTDCCFLARPQFQGERRLLGCYHDPLEAACRIMATYPEYYLPEEREQIFADIADRNSRGRIIMGRLGQKAA